MMQEEVSKKERKPRRKAENKKENIKKQGLTRMSMFISEAFKRFSKNS